jgi:hypothetical protein
VPIGPADLGKQVTDSFAKLVAIGLVYRIMLMVNLFALPLAVMGAFVALPVTGRGLLNCLAAVCRKSVNIDIVVMCLNS